MPDGRTPLRLACAALLLAATIGACGGRGETAQEPVVEDAGAGGPVVDPIDPIDSVESEPARRYIAVIAAERSVDLAPKLPGELVAVLVRVGDEVEEGAVIATLDNRAAREALGMAKAELASARAARKQNDVEVADARRKLEIERKLVEQGTHAKRNEQDAQFALDKAVAARRSADAAVAESRARLKTLERELGETSIRAPFAGTVAMQYRNAGALVGPTIPIVRLISGNSLWVRFAVPANDAEKIALETRVRVDIDGLDEPLAGVVREIAPEIDPASRMIFVEAELTLSDAMRDHVRSGMNAWATLTGSEPD